MLRPDQFTSAFPTTTTGPVFLSSFSRQYSEALIVQTEGSELAILLDKEAEFRCVDRQVRHRLEGAFVLGVGFEVDHKTIYDPNRHGCRLGSLIRRDSELLIVVQHSGHHGFWDSMPIPVLENLPEAERSCEIGFTGWRLFVGEGDEKCELYRREPVAVE